MKSLRYKITSKAAIENIGLCHLEVTKSELSALRKVSVAETCTPLNDASTSFLARLLTILNAGAVRSTDTVLVINKPGLHEALLMLKALHKRHTKGNFNIFLPFELNLEVVLASLDPLAESELFEIICCWDQCVLLATDYFKLGDIEKIRKTNLKAWFIAALKQLNLSLIEKILSNEVTNSLPLLDNNDFTNDEITFLLEDIYSSMTASSTLTNTLSKLLELLNVAGIDNEIWLEQIYELDTATANVKQVIEFYNKALAANTTLERFQFLNAALSQKNGIYLVSKLFSTLLASIPNMKHDEDISFAADILELFSDLLNSPKLFPNSNRSYQNSLRDMLTDILYTDFDHIQNKSLFKDNIAKLEFLKKHFNDVLPGLGWKPITSDQTNTFQKEVVELESVLDVQMLCVEAKIYEDEHDYQSALKTLLSIPPQHSSVESIYLVQCLERKLEEAKGKEEMDQNSFASSEMLSKKLTSKIGFFANSTAENQSFKDILAALVIELQKVSVVLKASKANVELPTKFVGLLLIALNQTSFKNSFDLKSFLSGCLLEAKKQNFKQIVPILEKFDVQVANILPAEKNDKTATKSSTEPSKKSFFRR